IENGIEAAYKQKADLIVICSSDDEYLQYCKQISGSLSKSVSNSKLIIAGYPKEGIEELNNNGVFDFIHLKTNHLESLSKYQQLFDIID
ncbi:MAG: methylmalonyl-CoA mutase small subunit, partial [Bacteroidetes bacterium]|nr:methylmalonyl-CoA mutase small subunit [Bacteroidota bacterium]